MTDTNKNATLNIIKRIHNNSTLGNEENKLSKVVKIIAEEMSANVVELYVKADDVTLELVGCSKEIEEQSAVRVGVGLVGKVGLDNQISFLSGKKNFQIASPIMRWGKITGVLHLKYPSSLLILF